MDKIRISSEWTDAERLLVIASILVKAYRKKAPLFVPDVQLLLFLAGMPSGFLEANRDKWSEYVEVSP